MDIYQPFGNGRGEICTFGEGARPPPKIGLGPNLSEVSHRDESKRSK